MTTAPDDEVHQVISALQDAQRREDVDAFVGLFAPDATWVTAHGKRLIGRAEIAAFTAQVLPGAMRDSSASYEVVHIVYVRPDVAIAAVVQRPLTLEGDPLPGVPEGRPTYVLAKDDAGAWRIVAGQNTQVHPG
jgi:uncharacterized protein (TIGR02246 family)